VTTRPDDTTEDIEGLDQGSLEGWGEGYPLDSVFVRTELRTVSEVVKRIAAGRFQLDPDFQRDFVWPTDKQSRLVESCVMRIPLPVFYVAESKGGKIAVVDGLQRLTTFSRFLHDEFPLNFKRDEDDAAHPLDGKRFSELPIQLRERIEDTQLTLYILDEKAPERAKLDIFERVNSGVPLTRQQMRNCLFNGEATTWLREAAHSAPFLKATGSSLDSKSMRDREAINRFCAFYLLGESKYRSGDIDAYLAHALEYMQSDACDLDQLTKKFHHSMHANHHLFGNHAFRRSLALEDQSSGRSVINIALFDVFSVILADTPKSCVVDNTENLKSAFSKLINNAEFAKAIATSTNSTKHVKLRFEMARQTLKECLND
jgi:hypothetical protein